MIKFPYKSLMRNKDGTTFPVQWLVANPAAKPLPYVTPFASSRFDPIQYMDLGGIGEINERFPDPSIGFVPPWATGGHVCGTADQWMNGFDSGFARSPFGPDGWPLCCTDAAGAEFADDYDQAYWI